MVDVVAITVVAIAVVTVDTVFVGVSVVVGDDPTSPASTAGAADIVLVVVDVVTMGLRSP